MRSFRLSVAVCGTFALAWIVLIAAHPLGRPAIEGAWQAVFSSYEAPDTSWRTSHPPSNLYLFTRRYYSIMTEWGTEPRKPFRDGMHPTEAEELASVRAFVANSGTYDLTDSTLTVRPIVSRNPNFATDLPNSGHQRTNRFSYRIQGDTLWLLRFRVWGRDTTKREVLRNTLVRIE